MIVYYLVLIILGALQVVVVPITFLPDVSFPPELNSSIGAAGNYIGIFNAFLPKSIPTIFTIFVIYLGIEAGIYGYKLTKWVYSKIPGIN